MKISFLDKATIDLNDDMDFSKLSALGDFKSYDMTFVESEIVECLSNTDVAIVNKVVITRDVIERLPNLKHIAIIATGFNNVDLKACEEKSITVSNVQGYAKQSVPQHVFALILNLVLKIKDYDRDVNKGEWQESEIFTLLKYPTYELSGKTLGIIGFGTIGQEVARIGQAFGMNVIMNRRSGTDLMGFPYHPLDFIYENSDIISLNCPLTSENKGMINASTLKKMKESSYLINTARGPLIEESDLAQALNEGWIAGAGIDVLTEEPPKDNHLLRGVQNLIITPHSAWTTIEARQRLIDDVTQTITLLKQGKYRSLVV